MVSLAQALHIAATDSGGASWVVPDGWQQGRGAFGGLTLAALANAASISLGSSDRPLRTITAELPDAVVIGPAELHVTRMREGHALSTVAAELRQRGAVAAHAVFNFGKTRDVGFDRAAAASSFPAFADTPISDLGPVGPVFTQHFEYRIVQGIPVSGAAEAVSEGWIRLREPGEVAPAIALLALIDAWFPSVLPVFRAPRPFGTIAFAAHFFERAWRPHEPLFHRSRLLGSQDGYFAEVRELFTARGELCAINQQTMAIIK